MRTVSSWCVCLLGVRTSCRGWTAAPDCRSFEGHVRWRRSKGTHHRPSTGSLASTEDEPRCRPRGGPAPLGESVGGHGRCPRSCCGGDEGNPWTWKSNSVASSSRGQRGGIKELDTERLKECVLVAEAQERLARLVDTRSRGPTLTQRADQRQESGSQVASLQQKVNVLQSERDALAKELQVRCATETCVLCEAGRFKRSGGSDSLDSCESCPPGTSSPSGATACADCLPRMFSEYEIPECASCQPSFFGDVSGMTTRPQCAIGTDTSTTQQSTCTNCLPGMFKGCEMVECASCQPGYFGSGSGVTTCSPCADGTYSSTEGQTACNACPEGSVLSAQDVGCRQCPSGTYRKQLDDLMFALWCWAFPNHIRRVRVLPVQHTVRRNAAKPAPLDHKEQD